MKKIGHNKIFVTLFPRCKNIELLKDVGMIPYYMGRCYGYESYVACYGHDEYTYIDKEVEGLKIVRIPQKYDSVVKDGCEYLIKNAKYIDVLNVYHLIYSESLQWVRLYKKINPEGKVYLKLDLDYIGLNKHKQDNMILRLLKKRILRKCDLISVESVSICDSLKQLYGINIKHMPNGIYRVDNKLQCDDSNIHKKQNVFLTVGRLGTKQKATEILLEAFALSAEKHDWRLRLAGSIDENFSLMRDDFEKKYANIINRVEFVGEIIDREKLQKEYEMAKVFVLPSRWESYGIVLAEAQCSGCYIITTEAVPPAKEMTCNGRYGSIVKTDDVEELAEKMVELANGNYSTELEKEIRVFANERYNWKHICMKIEEALR